LLRSNKESKIKIIHAERSSAHAVPKEVKAQMDGTTTVTARPRAAGNHPGAVVS
jgi:hypothetical protein